MASAVAGAAEIVRGEGFVRKGSVRASPARPASLGTSVSLPRMEYFVRVELVDVSMIMTVLD